MHNLIKPTEIVRLANKWFDLYRDNNERGELITSFIAGTQWDQITRSERNSDGKEVLTLNMVLKHFYRVIAEFMEVEYQLEVSPNITKLSDEIKNAESLLKNFILECNEDEIYEAFFKYAAYGYTTFEIIADYPSENNFQLVPKLKHFPLPDLAFFDCDAQNWTKRDGKYWGKVNFISIQTLKTL